MKRRVQMKWFFFLRCDPTRVMASSFLMFLDHTQRRNALGRTPLDEWPARRKDLYLTAHNNHNRQISMPPVGFGPTISAGERPQTYALDRAATGTGRGRAQRTQQWVNLGGIYWTAKRLSAVPKGIRPHPVRHLEPFSNRVHSFIARLRHLAIETVELHNPLHNRHKRYAISMFLSSVYQFPFESLHCLLCHKPSNNLAPVSSTVCDASRIVTSIVYILQWNDECLRKETATGRRI